MNKRFLPTFIGLLFLIGCSHGGKQRQCRRFNVYVPTVDNEIKCVRCQTCPLGQEFDLKVKLNKSTIYGNLECPPCKPCDNGYYRQSEALETCTICRKNCSYENRVWKRPCGGTSVGECGDCFEGYIPTGDGHSICRKEPQKEPKIDLKVKQIPAIHNTVNNTISVEGNTFALLIAGIISLIAVIAAAGFGIRRLCIRKQNGEEVPTESVKTLIQSNSSRLGELNSGTIEAQIETPDIGSTTRYEHINLADVFRMENEENENYPIEETRSLLDEHDEDLETDSPPVEPRPELPVTIDLDEDPPRGELNTEMKRRADYIDSSPAEQQPEFSVSVNPNEDPSRGELDTEVKRRTGNIDSLSAELRPELTVSVYLNEDPPRGELNTEVKRRAGDIDSSPDELRPEITQSVNPNEDPPRDEINTETKERSDQSPNNPENPDLNIPEKLVDKYANKVLKNNSKELDLVSRNISGDDVFAFFRMLGLKKSNYEPDYEKWMNEKKDYKDYILDVLIEWLQLKPEATLTDLWLALKEFKYIDAQNAVIEFLIKLDLEEKSNVSAVTAAVKNKDDTHDRESYDDVDDKGENANKEEEGEMEKSFQSLSGELYNESIDS